MNGYFVKSFRIAVIALALCEIALMPVRLQATSQTGTAVIEGKVQDFDTHAVVGVVVSLQEEGFEQARTYKTDAQGRFRFDAVAAGSYTLHVKLQGYPECVQGPIILGEHETKSTVLSLAKEPNAASRKDDSSALAFSDEPAFTVAGVTDTTALGGHGSGPLVRNSNALSKETASLANNGDVVAGSSGGSAASNAAEEATIREKLAHSDTAELHEQLAEIEEREGHPLDAVHDYQRAAEIQPSEPNLFAWGAELLLHHAPEPAIEVFSKGHRLYPQSSRMMLGLGAAWYAQRSKEQAEQTILDACDVNPADATPYLFLGRLQVTEPVISAAWVTRMKRFATVHPEMAMSHYLYAVALIKQAAHPEQADLAQAELKRAIELDPHFGDAYLQLGILYSQREDFPAAVSALQKAIANTPIPDDAHYRLAQIYRRTGETEKAQREIALFKQLEERKNEQAERERHEIPQFVYTLREQHAPPPASTPESH
jgi:tetratricopeptide (TPR) repeat protein